MKIGAMIESFNLGFEASVKKAAEIGIEGLQMYATKGRFSPEEATDADLKYALDFVHDHGMVFSAICGDYGHASKGFSDPELNKIYVEKSKRVLDIAKKLECNIVTTHINQIPEEENETTEIMQKACRELAIYADSIGSSFAVETGPEPGERLAGFLDSLGAGGVRVNFDPANLVMVAGDRPENALQYLGRYIVHTHAKDGIKLNGHSINKFKHTLPDEIWEPVHEKNRYLEVPLGMGDVDFDIYLPALRATGYDGFLTIERECGSQPEKDIAMAYGFLKEKLQNMHLKQKEADL